MANEAGLGYDGGLTCAIECADLDQSIAGHDVRFDGETQTIPGMVRLAAFFDPDGNRHMLYQDLSQEGETC